MTAENDGGRACDAAPAMDEGETAKTRVGGSSRSIGGGDARRVERDLSNWNLLFERKLELGPALSLDEHRLLDALARCLLGFNRTSDRLGEALLRERSGLHGRSFERARGGLVEKGLLVFESGGRGRGKRSLYALVLVPEENPATERDFEPADDLGENPAPERDYWSEKPAKNPAENPAPERGRSEKGVGESRKAFPGSNDSDGVAAARDARRGSTWLVRSQDGKLALRYADEDEARSVAAMYGDDVEVVRDAAA